MILLLAHAGHWLPYVLPAAIVLIAAVGTTLRERHLRARGSTDEPGGPG